MKFMCLLTIPRSDLTRVCSGPARLYSDSERVRSDRSRSRSGPAKSPSGPIRLLSDPVRSGIDLARPHRGRPMSRLSRSQLLSSGQIYVLLN